ncbi:MAG: DUF4366 domain-containing protein [Schaedlerella sp.]|nr:DUF4366 domain-containing protein [Schaedlerella sp.]
MVSKKIKKLGMALSLCLVLMLGTSINAFAYVDESATEKETVAVQVEESLSETEEESIEGNTEDTTESNGVFSEGGNLTLVDDIDGEASEGLQYMTVTTKSGVTFYLVIDRTSDSENVYFLNQVDELDLMAIMDDTQKAEYENSLSEQNPVEDTTVSDVIVEPSEPVVDDVTEEKTEIQTVNPALYAVIAVVAIAIIGGYMFMKKKGKKADDGLDEDLELYDDEEYENEDEQEPEFAEEEDVD